MRTFNINSALRTLAAISFFLVLLFSSAFADVNSDISKKSRIPVYYDFVQKNAEPVGGLEAIVSKITYPQITRMARMEGRVVARVYVDEKGRVNDVEIIKGVAGGCRESVESAIRQTKFTPAILNGRPVRSKTIVTVKFSLSE